MLSLINQWFPGFGRSEVVIKFTQMYLMYLYSIHMHGSIIIQYMLSSRCFIWLLQYVEIHDCWLINRGGGTSEIRRLRRSLVKCKKTWMFLSSPMSWISCPFSGWVVRNSIQRPKWLVASSLYLWMIWICIEHEFIISKNKNTKISTIRKTYWLVPRLLAQSTYVVP